MNGKQYWEDRAVNLILQSERSVLDFEQSLIEAYETAIASIQKEIDAFYGKYAIKNKIPYSEVRKKLLGGEFKSFKVLLKEWVKLASELGEDSDYYKYLEQLGNRVYLTRLESLEANIRYHIEKLKLEQFNSMNELVTANYQASYYQSYFDLAQGIGSEVVFNTIDEKGIKNAVKARWDGHNYSTKIWDDKDALLESIKKTLPQSFSRGLNARQLGDMIAKDTNKSKVRGQALARTEINFLCNQAALDTYKLAGIEKYEFLATLDMRTSEICRDLDGYIGKVSEAKVNVNYPPMHVNCRSTTIPHFETEVSQFRIARDSEGQNILVPRRMTQVEWIKKYVPEDQQEKMLKFVGKYRPTE